MLKRIIKILGTLIIVTIVLVVVKAQIDAEKYITKQKQTYGILENRPRLKHPLFVWHFFTKADNLGYVIHQPYEELNLRQHVSNGIYDQYLIHCYYSKKEIEKYAKNSLKNYGHGIWNLFVQAVEEKNIDYLLRHSFDTIFCTDCVPNSASTNEKYESKEIFEKHLNLFMKPDLLKQNDFSLSINDSTMIVNYSIKCGNAPEGAFNMVYRFEKGTTYKLKDRFSVP